MGWWGVTTLARVSREDFLEEVVLEKIGNGEKDQPDGDLQNEPSRHRKEQGALFWVRTLGPVRRRDLFKATGQRSTAELAEAGGYLLGSPRVSWPVGGAADAVHTCSLCQRKFTLRRSPSPGQEVPGMAPRPKLMANIQWLSWGSHSPAPLL